MFGVLSALPGPDPNPGPVEPARQMTRAEAARSRALRILIGGVVSAGAIAAALMFLAGGYGSPIGLAVLLGLVVLTETLGVKLYLDGRLSISFMGIVIAALAFGPGATALVATTIAITVFVSSPSDIKKLAFNMGHQAIGAAVVAGLAALPIVHENIEFAAVALPAGAVLAAFLFAITSAAVSRAIALSSDQRTGDVHSELFRWMLPHYIGLGAVAGGLALAYEGLGVVGLLLLAAPLALSRHSVSQVVEKTRVSMDRLERSNEQLRDANAANAAILAAIPDVMYHLDANGNVIEANIADPEQPRRRRNSGTHFASGFPPVIARKLQRALADAQRDETLQLLEYELPRDDGTLAHFEARAVPVRGGEALLMVRDVTERKRTQAAMAEAQKLESLGVLAGGIAHDFNNLLVGILGNADLALLEVEEDSPARETLLDIRLAGRRAADLARQMLAYAGKGRLEVERIDFGKLVAETSQLLRSSVNKGISIDMDVQQGASFVEVDATQLRQVVMNLVVNASDAIGHQPGHIAVSVREEFVSAETLASAYATAGLAEGRYVSLSVSDTGSGMDAETQARIFDPFFTTKATGHGLGLAAVLGIIRSHKGAIRVESEPGAGTTFTVLLPALAAVAQEVEATATAEAAWDAAGTILVIDDDEAVRRLTRRAVALHGFDVIEAVDGQDGVDKFREHAREIVAVILDMTMPKLTGDEVLAQVRAIDPSARVILMSGYADEAVGVNSGQLRPDAFIQKPFTIEALSSALKEVTGAGETAIQRRAA